MSDPFDRSEGAEKEAESQQAGALAPSSEVLTMRPVVVSDQDEDEQSGRSPFPVVGIAASAGGLEAFSELFRATPSDTGMAFVVISHLAAHQKSLLAELLGKATDMQVEEAKHNQPLEQNHVYVIPPNARITVSAGRLQLTPRPERDRSPKPADIFFRSLATEQKSFAIGIVLSGTDSDGALGLAVIKGEGGICIVQDESSARFEDMPRNAIASDHVDLILNPAQIGEELGRIGQEFRRGAITLSGKHALMGEDQQTMLRVYSLLRAASGIDFVQYKQSTVRRRLARRMVIRKMETLPQYVQMLQVDLNECKELYEDILIGVTRFFRDPAVFQALKDSIFPLLLRDRPPGHPIRVWVAGCSSGEEAYSLAICLWEYLGASAVETPIQIFATDVSEQAIERARAATYPDSLAGDISAERLRRFFVKTEKGYMVAKSIRELCVFARHNLAQDPPFSRMDLISCRNVLIYLGAALQQTIIPAFHYALRHPGFLILGSSETIREYADLFTPFDRKHKFYSRTYGSSRVHMALNPRQATMNLVGTASTPKTLLGAVGADLDLQRSADRIVLARYGPAGVIVNEHFEILQSRGDTSPYLSLPPGSPTLNLLRMAKEGLGQSLKEGLSRAISLDIPVVLEHVQIRRSDYTLALTVEVLPMQNLPITARTFLVLFVPEVATQTERAYKLRSEDTAGATSEEREREFQQARQDLASTKIYLQALVEDRDSKNQELISANEEIQSSNEELQSINEELETAKEELQSANEELQSVNEELDTRNAELSQRTNDLINLLNNLTVPVLILDSELRIRQFTPLAEKTMNVRAADVGRSISEIRLNLAEENLEPLFREVIDSLATKELEVQDRKGCWHLLRARPYRTSDNKIDGVVMVLVDINQIRTVQQELTEASSFAHAVLESVHTPLVVLQRDLRVRMGNRSFLRLCGFSKESVNGRFFPELAKQTWNLDTIEPMLESLNVDHPDSTGFSLEHEWGENGQEVLLVNAHIVDGPGSGVLMAFEDITIRKQAQRMLHREKERLEGRVHITEQALDLQKEELQRLTASLFKAQETERRRVAGELHDDLSQKVAILEIGIERLERQLPDSASFLRKEMGEIRKKAGELTEDLHRMARQLHPQVLEDLGLAVALKRLANEFEARENMPVRFTSRDLPESIPRDTAFCFYRITQEALRNISKHAGNAPVEILVAGTKESLCLQIRDFGSGFRQEAKQSKGGLGFISMQERVRQIGGTLSVDSEPDEGTTVRVDAPLSGKDHS